MTGLDELDDGFEELRRDFPGWHFSSGCIAVNSGSGYIQYQASAPGMHALAALSLTDLRALLQAAGQPPA